MNILKIIWDFLKQKNNMLIAVVVAIILVLLLTVYFQRNKIANLKDKYVTEVKLKNALLDTIHVYQNIRNEWVAEKLTIQESIKNLEKMNNQLSGAQKELIERVKEIDKNNKVIAAALIETNVLIGNLRPPKVDVNDSSVVFSDSTSDLDYNIRVGYVMPLKSNIIPTLTFNKFIIPNKQLVEFHWRDNKKEGYPISFSVLNSNKYFKTANIESYAIENLIKEDIAPTGWNKFGKWVVVNGEVIGYVSVGVVGGATLFWLFSK